MRTLPVRMSCESVTTVSPACGRHLANTIERWCRLLLEMCRVSCQLCSGSRWWVVQVEVVHTAPRTAAPPHHVMKEVKPILSENLRLSKSLMGDLQYDNQQTGVHASHLSSHCVLSQ